jgi:glycosyltransferase involved in cell wall biosynthesis
VTTATQISQPGTDMTWVPHLLYRYLEVLSCGSLLIAHNVPGINRYFVPGIHFIDFESEMDAAEKILLLQKNSELRKKIANQGHLKAKNLINSNIFWASIDSALGNKSLI